MKDNRQRLFEVMGKVDPTFKPSAKLLTEWNFDKKKGEEKDEDKEEKKEDETKENSKEHEKKESPEFEKAEEEGAKEEKKELKEADAPSAKKIPVNMIAKVGGK
jgi:flagellar motor switch/type III secretory pathway protein FliN